MELARQSRLCLIIQRYGGLAFLSLDPGHSEQAQNGMRVSVEVRATYCHFESSTAYDTARWRVRAERHTGAADRLHWRRRSGYPAVRRWATMAKRSLSGQALDRQKRMRLVLRQMTSPIFKSLRRMVPAWSAGEFGACQAQPPHRGQQAISEAGQQQAELV